MVVVGQEKAVPPPHNQWSSDRVRVQLFHVLSARASFLCTQLNRRKHKQWFTCQKYIIRQHRLVWKSISIDYNNRLHPKVHNNDHRAHKGRLSLTSLSVAPSSSSSTVTIAGRFIIVKHHYHLRNICFIRRLQGINLVGQCRTRIKDHFCVLNWLVCRVH